jgi:hypothetical protein
MTDFTQEERNLMMLYSPGTKTGLYQALMQMKSQLTRGETELCSLTDSVLSKLSGMDDKTFETLELYPDF